MEGRLLNFYVGHMFYKNNDQNGYSRHRPPLFTNYYFLWNSQDIGFCFGIIEKHLANCEVSNECLIYMGLLKCHRIMHFFSSVSFSLIYAFLYKPFHKHSVHYYISVQFNHLLHFLLALYSLYTWLTKTSRRYYKNKV
jgi:hypothetical protein